jgi:hypothetical protein
MRRDLVFVVLLIVVVAFILLFFLDVGGPADLPQETTDPAATGTATDPGVEDARGKPLEYEPGDPKYRAPDEGGEPGEPKTERKPAAAGDTGEPKAPAALDHVIEAVSFEDATLAEVLEVLAAETGLTFHAPDDLLRGDDTAKVTLAASRITVRNVIELVVLTKRWKWEARPDGTVHIWKED